jgi:hypothetical protein
MATLDSLLVQIDASTELLRRELAKGGAAVESFARNTERRAAGFADSFKKAGAQIRSVMGLFGVGFAVSGVQSFLRNSIQAADAIGETARAAGFGAERFQRLSFVFRQNGLSAQEFDAAMRTLNTRLGQFLTTGAGPAEKAFDQLGIKQRILSGEIRTSEQAFEAIAEAFGNVGGSAQQAAVAAALFGREVGSKMTPALQQGVSALNAAAEAATGIFSDETVRKADALGDAWERIASAAGNYAKSIAVNATYGTARALGVDEAQFDKLALEDQLAELRRRLMAPPMGMDPFDWQDMVLKDIARVRVQMRERDRVAAAAGLAPGFGGPGIKRIGDFVDRNPGARRPDIKVDWLAEDGLAEILAGNGKALELPISLQLVQMPDWQRALEPLKEQLRVFERVGAELSRSIGRGLQDSFADAFRGIDVDFKSLVKSMAAELAASGLMRLGFLALGGPAAVSAGGLKGFFADVFSGSRANGGPVQRGKGYLINEGKPELFWPGVSGSMVPVSKTGSGSTLNITTNVDARGATSELVNQLPAILDHNNAKLKYEIFRDLSLHGRRPTIA